MNVSWSYSNADPQYPLRVVGVYYRQVGVQNWVKITDVGARVRQANLTISSVAPGNYEVSGSGWLAGCD